MRSVKGTVFSFLLFISIITQAQVKLDSLWTVWNDEAAPDSGRARAMHQIVYNYYVFKYPDSAFHYAQMLYDFASERDLKMDMANAFNIQGISYYVRSNYEKALEYYAKSLKIKEEISDKRGIAVTLNNMGMIHVIRGDYPNALDHYQRSLTIVEEISDYSVMASILSNIGGIFKNQGDYPKAFEYLQRSLVIREEISDRKGMGNVLNSLGSIFLSQGSYPRALDYYQRSYKVREEFSDSRGMASSLNNIGLIYNNQNDLVKALDYFQRSLKIKEEISDKNGMALTLNNIGVIHRKQGNYSRALECFQISLEIKEEISDKIGIADALHNIGELFSDQGNYAEALIYYQRSLSINEELSNKKGIAINLRNIGMTRLYQVDYTSAIDWCSKALLLSEELNALQIQRNACECLYAAYKSSGIAKKALEYHERISILNDSLKEEETNKKLQQMEFARKILADSLLQEKEKLRVELAHKEEVRKKNRTRNIFILSALVLLFGALGIHRRMVFVRRAKTIIENEKERSDKLLLNILPAEIAEELKEKGRADARKFENVSILFSDFKGFTQLSEQLSAEELVGEINTCFETFDGICKKYGIERIKTIGDSYMAAGGLPVGTDESVKNTILAGLEMAEFMNRRKLEKEEKREISFEMRLGIHTGPVVAGIVGISKFHYDVWGDTVNTASRMESSGDIGKVNISRSVYELVKTDPIFKFQSRGKVKTKGKGVIEMWFVEKV